jgi:hypothetical protein
MSTVQCITSALCIGTGPIPILDPAAYPGMPVADAPNRLWTADFQFDATDGRPIKITADVAIDELDRLATSRGYQVPATYAAVCTHR